MMQKVKNNYFDRFELMIGSEKLEILRKTHILLIGVGGVGGYILEALVRSGIGEITLYDGDAVDSTNINRQIIATSKNIGVKKALLAEQRALAINPDIVIHSNDIFVTNDNIDAVFNTDYDYVIDACDSVPAKVALICKAKEKNLRIISAMGCGNKMDPSQFKIADINQTKVCPLAKIIRLELRKRGISNVKVLFSLEEPIKINDNVISSNAFTPSIAGLLIAREVILDLIK